MTVTTHGPLVGRHQSDEQAMRLGKVGGRPGSDIAFAAGLATTETVRGEAWSVDLDRVVVGGPERVRPYVAGRPVRRARRQVAGSCAGAAAPSMHGAGLTRRGRVLVGLAWLVLVVVAAVPIVRAVSVPPDATPSTATVTIVEGDTLWDVARAIDPSGDRREIVSTIVELNDLASPADIRPGQRLDVPTGR